MALLKKALFSLAIFLGLSFPAFGGSITVDNFGGGLNTQDSPLNIDASQAQSLLNVNFTPGGSAVYKRDGYGLFQNLPINTSTTSVHGGYHFQQLSGNDVQLWGNDTELSASVSDGTFVRIATGTVGATWQCADSQGSAYCFSSSNDTPVKTDGTTANTTYQGTISSGTMAVFTPTQLVVAGVPGYQNTLFVSAQNNFLNFTVGTLPSSAFQEPIVAPGSRITHIGYYFGKLFWWKDQSFGYMIFTTQNDVQVVTVSNQIGTTDNSDAFWNSSGYDAGSKISRQESATAYKTPGGIYFRGQDNHLYVYDGYFLTRLSRVITPTVASANKRKANSWAQNTTANFNNGAIVPTVQLSTTIATNAVIVSSFQAVENSATQWNSGSTNNTTVNSNSITLSTNNSGNITNPDFESSFTGNWNGGLSKTASASGDCGTISAQHGSFYALIPYTGSGCGSPTMHLHVETVGGTILQDVGIAPSQCTWTQGTATPTANQLGERVKIRLCGNSVCGAGISSITSDSYIWGGPISVWTNYVCSASNNSGGFDNIQNGSSTITSGAFTSQSYNTGFASATYQISQFTDAFDGQAPTFDLQTATSTTGVWTELETATGTNAVGNQYVRWTSTITINSAGSPFGTYLSSITIISESTGTYYSAVNNAPNLTTWGNINVTDSKPGASAITYYTRSSTNSFSTLSSTPAWVAQTKNATVTASTGTYFQLRGDFSITAATEAPTLSDFTFNWYEGSSSDKSYMAYFNDAIWFSVSLGTSTGTNNRIFYWDLLNGAWSLYDISANGFLAENNTLYFGDPSQGRVFKYASASTDNGSAISSYWRSKAFLSGGTVPNESFVQKEFNQADFLLGETPATLTYTYTLDSSRSTAFSLSGYSSTDSLIQRNFLLPKGKLGKYYDFQLSDNSSSAPWRMMGHRVIYNPLNWVPVLQ